MKDKKLEKLVGTAMLAGVVIVLQYVGNFIKLGNFSVSLVLLPIVIGAALYGPLSGCILGCVFGGVIVFGYLTGNVDILWISNPILTAIVCFVKGAAAGLFSGFVFRLFSKNNKLSGRIIGSYGAAITCPIVNTGIFLLAIFTIFKPQLIELAGGTNVYYFAFVGLAGINFLIELGVNIILAPVVINIVNAVRKYK